jgi:dihydroneopterin aldolase
MAGVMESVVPLRPATSHVAETLVRLDGFEVMAAVGVNHGEIGRRQPLRIWAELALLVGAVERLEQTVDYRAIGAAAEALARGHIGLIESFARQLGEACLQMGDVSWARVRIDKPEAVDNGMASVTVLVRRS